MNAWFWIYAPTHGAFYVTNSLVLMAHQSEKWFQGNVIERRLFVVDSDIMRKAMINQQWKFRPYLCHCALAFSEMHCLMSAVNWLGMHWKLFLIFAFIRGFTGGSTAHWLTHIFWPFPYLPISDLEYVFSVIKTRRMDIWFCTYKHAERGYRDRAVERSIQPSVPIKTVVGGGGTRSKTRFSCNDLWLSVWSESIIIHFPLVCLK